MTQQPLIGHQQHHGGFWSNVKDPDGGVHDGAWRLAIQLHQHVGTCKECGQQLKPSEPDTGGRITFYPAICIGCGHELVGRGPRPEKPKKGAA